MHPGHGGTWLLAISLAAIAAATLSAGGGGASGICVLCGERGLADFLANLILFAPLGAAFALRGWSLERAIAAAALLSIGIEAAQLTLVPDRDANPGDVLANSLGALGGWALGHSRDWWTQRESSRARAASVTITTVALLLGALALFAPAFPATTYHLQWTADFDNLEHYEGRVVSTRLADLEWHGPPWRMEPGHTVRRLLREQPMHIELKTGPPPAGVAPIVSIYDDVQREIMLLGADGTDLVYRFRAVANELRLDHADVRIHDVFAGMEPGVTAELSWDADTKQYCVQLNDDSKCVRGFTAGDTWSLLLSPEWGAVANRLMGVFWMWLAFLPAGFLVRTRVGIATAAVFTVVLLVGGPLAAGLAATPAAQLAAACLGLLSGHAFNRLSSRTTAL